MTHPAAAQISASGVPIELICENEYCKRKYTPKRLLFNPDGTLRNRVCSQRCKGALSWKRQNQKAGNRLADEQLEAANLDTAWEARNGIMDRVACRLCGRLVKRLSVGLKLLTHLRTKHPGVTLREYRALCPCSPKTPAAGKKGKRAKGVIDDYVFGAELLACRADPRKAQHDDFVVCCLCGLKLRSRLSLSDSDSIWGCRHLQTQHDMTMEQYLRMFPGAPIFHLSGLEKNRKRVEDVRTSIGKLATQGKILEAVASMNSLRQKIAIALLIDRSSGNEQVKQLVLKLTGESVSTSTVERVRTEMGLARKKGRPGQNL